MQGKQKVEKYLSKEEHCVASWDAFNNLQYVSYW